MHEWNNLRCINGQPSPLLCDVFMESLVNELEEAGTPPRFWIRYVYDVLANRLETQPGAQRNRIHHGDRKGRKEERGDTFSGFKIIGERGYFEFDIYRKPTQTQRIITYISNYDFHSRFWRITLWSTGWSTRREGKRKRTISWKKNRYNSNNIVNRIQRQGSRQQLLTFH